MSKENLETPQAGRRWLTDRRSQAVIVSIVLVAACAWVLRKGGLPLLPPSGTLAGLDMLCLAGFVFGMAVNLTTRYARHHFLIAPIASVPFRRILMINAVGTALITFLPLRLGELARPAMLREKGHLSAWAVTGTVAAERIIDGVAFSGTLIAGLLLAVPREPLPDRIGELPVPAKLVPQIAWVASTGFGVAFVVMALFYAFRTQARWVTERVVGVVSVKLAHRVSEIVTRLSDGFKFLVDLRHSAPYVVITVISVFAQVWGTQLLAFAVGLPELTFAEAMVVTGVVALGFAMPNAPGFFGTVQLALYGGLAAYIPPSKVALQGAALVFVFYVTYLALVVLFAGVALVGEWVAPPRSALEGSDA